MKRRSWLVQRLEKPYPKPEGHPLFGKGNPWAFGGGIRNGGLSDEAMGLLHDIWRFDYMGAAEFEFGAVPEALNAMAKTPLVAYTFSIPLSKVAANWRDQNKEKPEGDATIYVIAPEGWEDEIERRIRGWAAESRHEDFRLKEPTRLSSTLRPFTEWDDEVCGWLEISNGFLFFADPVMWEKACSLFGVAAESHRGAVTGAA